MPSHPAGRAQSARLVESWFPFIEVSRLVAADRRSKDRVYGVHKWFARRPPTLVRALLLASHLDAEQSTSTFWKQHASPGPWLEGASVYDPFMGGGTSLVESARMSAAVAGRDVDPIAVAIVGSELASYSDGFDAASTELVDELAADFANLFVGPDEAWTPLHWFWLSRPQCPSCNQYDYLYKDLVLATSSGREGAVVREDAMHAFCPICLQVQAFGPGRVELRCCGRRHRISGGTYIAGRYYCPACGNSHTHEQLKTGLADRVLVAVEETHPKHYRRIRGATASDRASVRDAETLAAAASDGFDHELETCRRDRRPVSAGYTSTRSLFTARQWAVFTSAFSRLRTAGHDAALDRDLTLMLTGSLPANNVLCGYARDWGRLAPLFSVRGFSLPALSVELNPFHPTGGRGTFRSARARIMERANAVVRRARLDADGTVVRVETSLAVAAASVQLLCRSADDVSGQEDIDATICVTDPPYFDYIAYSELSEFFRTWLPDKSLSGAPLLPEPTNAVETFAVGLGAALKSTMERLRAGTPLVFTYHSANRDAWTAIGDAFDIAGLSVVALYPVLADPHMGHHVAQGNCEWDVIVVARRTDEVDSAVRANDPNNVHLVDSAEHWDEQLQAAGFAVGDADLVSFKHAWSMTKPRFAPPLTN